MSLGIMTSPEKLLECLEYVLNVEMGDSAKFFGRRLSHVLQQPVTCRNPCNELLLLCFLFYEECMHFLHVS